VLLIATLCWGIFGSFPKAAKTQGPAKSAPVRGAPPAHFVSLREVDPTIQQDMKYATADNFTGQAVPGYEARECVLTRAAADRLAEVQAELRPSGLALKVYDCFRPERAVRAFAAWSELSDETESSKRFHPNLSKNSLFALGYIAKASSHSHGTAVDLTLVQLAGAGAAPFDEKRTYGACNGPIVSRAPDSGVDMGTGFDCFDPSSHTRSSMPSHGQRAWREKLVKVMSKHGFRNYAGEWWHFTLAGR